MSDWRLPDGYRTQVILATAGNAHAIPTKTARNRYAWAAAYSRVAAMTTCPADTTPQEYGRAPRVDRPIMTAGPNMRIAPKTGLSSRSFRHEDASSLSAKNTTRIGVPPVMRRTTPMTTAI